MRRLFPLVACVLPLLVLTPRPSAAQVISKVVVLKELAGAVAAIGDAFSNLTQGLKDAVVAGVAAWDDGQARAAHSRLRNLSAGLTDLHVAQVGGALPNLEAFIAQPSAGNWSRFLASTTYVLNQANSLLTDVRKERSDFILDSAYRKLQLALTARVNLLMRLQQAGQPVTRAELAEVRTVLHEYRKLVANLAAATDELNVYLAK